MSNSKISIHTNRKEALIDTEFVQTTIQVGGCKPSTVVDFEIPKKFGLNQAIADTLGVGIVKLANNTRTFRYCRGPRSNLFKGHMDAICKSNVHKYDYINKAIQTLKALVFVIQYKELQKCLRKTLMKKLMT